MTKCKLCNQDISDGNEYCNDCLEKSKSNENNSDSYLESVNNAPEDEISIKNTANTENENKIVNLDSIQMDQDINEMAFNLSDDIEEFKNYDLEEDLKDDLSSNLEEDLKDDLSSYLEDDISEGDLLAYRSDFTNNGKGAENSEYRKEEEASMKEAHQDELDIFTEKKEQESQSEMIQNNKQLDEFEEYMEEDNSDPSLDDLINELETSEAYDGEHTIENSEQIPLQDGLQPANMDEIDTMDEISVDDDFLGLLNQIDENDPVADDVKAINDLLNEVENGKKENKNSLNDVGEVFSDALKVVSSLNDPEYDNIDLSQITDNRDKKNKKKKNKKTDKKEDTNNSNTTGNKSKKESIFKKLFGKSKVKKVDNEDTITGASGEEESAVTKEIPKQKKKKAPAKPPKKAKKKEKVKKDKESSKDKETSKDKVSKDKASIDNSEKEDTKDNNKKDKETTAKKPTKKQNRNAKNKPDSIDETKKKEKIDKKKKVKVAIQSIDEIDEDQGRINRAGALTIFLVFGILVIFLLIGTNIFSYTLSIKNANTYFDRKRYTQAYNEVYGIEIKDKDIETYDKIMTVMFVNKQLNSYNNYYTIKQYPEALDSLLKGLKRYDKYVELAKMLGIKSDLDYVRKQILSELKDVFNLSEEDAFKIIKSKNQKQYSMCVYDAVIEKMKK